MDFDNYSLRLFEYFEATQAKLQKNNLLKLSMPDSTTYVLTAYKNNVEQWYDYAYTEQELDDLKHNEGKAGRVEVRSIPRQQHSLNMITDEILRAKQRQNDLNAFIRYEQRLRDAYARSQNPYPGRRLRQDSSGYIRRHSQLTSLD
ncbi:MAG: hypothetical protein EBT12_11395 [Marivivens sp.]|nr:hypothetical protein [Marivivens sp.]